MIVRKPARFLLVAAVVKADKRQIRKVTRRAQDLYDRIGMEPWMLLATGRQAEHDGPEAA